MPIRASCPAGSRCWLVALAGDPVALLADEPTGELDSATGAQILDLLTGRACDGAPVLVAGHSAGVARRGPRRPAERRSWQCTHTVTSAAELDQLQR